MKPTNQNHPDKNPCHRGRPHKGAISDEKGREPKTRLDLWAVTRNEGIAGGGVMGRAEASQIAGIQYLRAFCAGIVVVSHENGFLAFPEYFRRAPLPDLHLVSLFAVAVFFGISGFIIVISALDGAWQPRISTWAFLLRRGVRILPFLWVCTFVYNGLSAVGTHVVDWGAMGRTLVLWPVGAFKPNVVWSLRHEALFYGLFAVTVLAWPRWRAVGIGWILAPLVFAPLIWDWHVVKPADGAVGYDLFRLVLAGGESGANLQFGVGITVGLAHLRGWFDVRRVRLSLWHLVGVFVVGCGLVHFTDLPSGLARAVVWSGLTGLILVAACLTWPRAAGSDRVALALGNGSFSLYLMHNTVMLIVLAVTMKLHFALHSEGQLLGYLGFCVLASLAACQALHYGVEKPLHRACANRLMPRRRG